MNYTDLSRYIVLEEDKFSDIYLKFNLLVYYAQLLTVDKAGKLIGVIGKEEIDIALKSVEPLNLTASDIMNKNFTFLVDNPNIRNECYDIFYSNNFDIIPIVTNNKKPIRLIHRLDFIEFRMISFSPFDGEDTVLNYVLMDIKKLFYIDIGANDPFYGNYTKWFSISGRGNGINIEPLNDCFNLLQADRPNDININTAIGDKCGELQLHILGVSTTAIQDYADGRFKSETAPVTTLENICKQHIQNGQEIHFLKIDVEGFEKQVLIGADFKNYRPWIIMIEATKPWTDIPTHNQWEDILLSNGYKFAKQYGVNRFYLADEHSILYDRFIDIEKINKRLIIYRTFK